MTLFVLYKLQLSSFGILAIAFIINQRFYKWSDFMDIELTTTPKILTAIGLGLFLIAVVGLCGVLRDSACLLTLVYDFISNCYYHLTDFYIVCPLYCYIVFHLAFNGFDWRTRIFWYYLQ